MTPSTAAVERFLTNRSSYCQVKTVTWYRYILNDLCDYFKNADLELVGTPRLEGFLAYQRERENEQFPHLKRKLAPSTLDDQVRVLKIFFRWCVAEELLAYDPSTRLKSPRHSELPKALTQEQVLTLAQILERGDWKHRDRDRALFYFLLDTGCRASETVNLCLGEDLNLTEGWARVLGKGQKVRIVGFVEQTAELLRVYVGRRRAGPLWLDRYKQPWTYAGMFFALRRLGKAANLHLSPHILRHTFATLYLEQHGQAAHLTLLLGHADAKTTERYVKAAQVRAALADHRSHSPILLLGDIAKQERFEL